MHKEQGTEPPDQNNLQAPKPQQLWNERLHFVLTISSPVPNDETGLFASLLAQSMYMSWSVLVRALPFLNCHSMLKDFFW